MFMKHASIMAERLHIQSSVHAYSTSHDLCIYLCIVQFHVFGTVNSGYFIRILFRKFLASYKSLPIFKSPPEKLGGCKFRLFLQNAYERGFLKKNCEIISALMCHSQIIIYFQMKI